MQKLLIAALLFAAAPALAAEPVNLPKDQGDRYAGPAGSSRSPVIAVHGMAATSQPLATQAAIDILKAGGSAVDAAIAANATLGLVEPTGSGVGGDLFAIVWDPKSRKLYGLNASGRAPMGQSLAQIRKANGGNWQLPPHGWLPVTVPGAVDGWFTLHARFGRLPIASVLAPATRYAEEGFPLSQLIASYWKTNTAAFGKSAAAGSLQESANMARVYMPGGRAPAEGELFRNPDLARTYRTIAAGGRDAFYKGELAAAMDGYFRRIGAPHRLSDFARQTSEWVEPISTNYRGYDVYELPPNGQGITALQILNILEGYDLRQMGRGSADFWHLFVEAKKLAFSDRARVIADPEFSKADWRQLLSKEKASRQREGIEIGRASLPAPERAKGGADTIYLTVADGEGMMVSLIQSNYRGMGSGLVPDDGRGGTLGFMFQDRGQQFSLDPKSANVYAPGKRPFHTIIPAFMMKDGKPLMSFGVMGGDMQPQGHAQIVVNMIDFGMDVQQAGDAARFHHDGSADADGLPADAKGGVVELESGVPTTVAEALRQRGHVVRYVTGPYGGYQAIWRDPATGIYRGASEFRKDGQAAGY